jgi:hypothetical protein
VSVTALLNARDVIDELLPPASLPCDLLDHSFSL